MRNSFQSDKDLIANKVQAAMETGNPNRAREVLAEYSDTFPQECLSIRQEVSADYRVNL